MKIHIGATAAAIAFGGPRKAITITCIHKWEGWNSARLLHCVICGVTAPKPVPVPRPETPDWHLHHRSCALRQGGTQCTC